MVDRQVAQTACIAINKAIKRAEKKFVAVSCHYDILDWLQPDWVLDTKDMKSFFFERPRPQKQFTIRKCDKREWAKFRRYHYLNCELSAAARCFGLYDGNEIIGFCAVMHFPHSSNKKIKRCSRIVILPDYQGIGLGTRFLTQIAKHFVGMGYDFNIVTSAKNMIAALRRSSNWTCIRYGRIAKPSSVAEYVTTTMRLNCRTASFFFKR